MSGMSIHVTDRDSAGQVLSATEVVHHFGQVSYRQNPVGRAYPRPIIVSVRGDLTIAQARALLRDLAGAVLAAEDDARGRLR